MSARGPRLRAAACALALAAAAHAPAQVAAPPGAPPATAAPPAPAAHDDSTALQESIRIAVEQARAQSLREFATESAAVAAYDRLERLREPLLAATEDPRQSIWLADAAEDALLIGLPADGCGIAAVAGLPTPAQRERATNILRRALAWAQAADAAARRTIASGQAPPELLARLDATELSRRVPLLRASAATLAAWCDALPSGDEPGILAASAARLEGLRRSLTGPSLALADLSLGLAYAQLGKKTEAESMLGPIAARRDAPEGSRVLAIVGMAECAAPEADGRRRALAAARERLGAELSLASLLVLGDAEFRHARDASAEAARTGKPADPKAKPPYAAWLQAAAAAPAPHRAAARQEALERIARNAGSMDDAVVRVARALQQARAPETRAQAAQALRTACADQALDAAVRSIAMLELGRTELLLGRPVEGAQALLDYAQAHPAEPTSRHAIDAAVAAARGSGDPVLLARVLATASARFPDHPDHATWRVEQSALALSPDTADANLEPPARRWARAVEGLDRADRAGVSDPAMRADLAIAAAEAATQMMRPEDALAVLQRVDRAFDDPGVPAGVRARLLEERIAALSAAGRAISGDRLVRAGSGASPDAPADAAARVLRRQLPADLATLVSNPPDERARSRALALADFVTRSGATSPDRDEVVVRALLAGGLHDSALPIARRLVAARGDRQDALLALAECLWAVSSPAALAEAMPLYDRIARGAVEESPAWWLAQLRRLQILDRVSRSVDAIAPKVQRLRAMDPGLGGPVLAPQFLDLAARRGS